MSTVTVFSFENRKYATLKNANKRGEEEEEEEEVEGETWGGNSPKKTMKWFNFSPFQNLFFHLNLLNETRQDTHTHNTTWKTTEFEETLTLCWPLDASTFQTIGRQEGTDALFYSVGFSLTVPPLFPVLGGTFFRWEIIFLSSFGSRQPLHEGKRPSYQYPTVAAAYGAAGGRSYLLADIIFLYIWRRHTVFCFVFFLSVRSLSLSLLYTSNIVNRRRTMQRFWRLKVKRERRRHPRRRFRASVCTHALSSCIKSYVCLF